MLARPFYVGIDVHKHPYAVVVRMNQTDEANGRVTLDHGS